MITINDRRALSVLHEDDIRLHAESDRSRPDIGNSATAGGSKHGNRQLRTGYRSRRRAGGIVARIRFLVVRISPSIALHEAD